MLPGFQGCREDNRGPPALAVLEGLVGELKQKGRTSSALLLNRREWFARLT